MASLPRNLVGASGFEPPTPRSRTECSTRLSHAPTEANHYCIRMRTRTFGRLKWAVSEVGYGMWGMGGWTGSDDDESARSLDAAVAGGCNFFDPARAYGEGRSERLLGALLRRHPDRRLYSATKVPPKNRRWPGRGAVDDVFPEDHILEYAGRSLENLGVGTIDLLQLHVWDDAWTP